MVVKLPWLDLLVSNRLSFSCNFTKISHRHHNLNIVSNRYTFRLVVCRDGGKRADSDRDRWVRECTNGLYSYV